RCCTGAELCLSLYLPCCVFVFFFFSSRRRHTRCLSDWSSDVCSSDLLRVRGDLGHPGEHAELLAGQPHHARREHERLPYEHRTRSEERRVGKEWRDRGSTDH